MNTTALTLPKRALCAAALFLALAAALWGSGGIGVLNRQAIAAHARAAGHIGDDFEAAVFCGDRMAALVFYDPALPGSRQCNAMVYVNRTGFSGGLPSVGWFFRGGGALCPPPGGGVAAYRVEGFRETAYLSANTEGYLRAEYADGRVAELDPALPIALVADCTVTFYTADGSAHTPTPASL